MSRPAGQAARVWLITGASSGFGRALAERALALGDTVIAASRGEPEGLAGRGPGRLELARLDVSDEGRAVTVVEEAIAAHGRIDVLVNNAGRGLFGAVEEASPAQLRELMDVHLFGPVALTRAALPHMRAAASGTIIQMSSQAGRFSGPGLGPYSATKFALEGWSEALAAEALPFGIRVMIVEPGPFRTSFYAPEAMRLTEPIAAYEGLLGGARSALAAGDAEPAGDPARGVEVILAALESAARRCAWHSGARRSRISPGSCAGQTASCGSGRRSAGAPTAADDRPRETDPRPRPAARRDRRGSARPAHARPDRRGRR